VKEAVLEKVTDMVVKLLEAKGNARPRVAAGDSLYENGLGLDSLDTATLAAMLENEFESDPYNAGEFPESISEIVDFYSGANREGL